MSESHDDWIKLLHEEFNREQFSDIRVVGGGGKVFYAHKLVLATRSAYFRTLLTTSLGAPSEVINLTDIASDVLEIVLRYMYTDVLKTVTSQNFGEILQVVDLLQVEGGRELCQKALIDAIDMYNCVVIYQLSRIYFAPEVTPRALE